MHINIHMHKYTNKDKHADRRISARAYRQKDIHVYRDRKADYVYVILSRIDYYALPDTSKTSNNKFKIHLLITSFAILTRKCI